MLFNRGKAISGQPSIKEQTNFQTPLLKQHDKEKYHNKA